MDIDETDMKALKLALVQLEARLQGWIEGGAARLFPGQGVAHELALRFAQALQDGFRSGVNGTAIAPNVYILLLHPENARALRESPALLDELARRLRQAGEEAGLCFASPPMVSIAAAPDLNLGQVRVLAQHSMDELPQTTGMQVIPQAPAPTIPRNAFFIVSGDQVYPLSQTVVNIGRRADNQLIIDDPRVSRLHAQLRAVGGSYTIFDLDSIGGTWVNGERTHQRTLHPGDVISLSGVTLIYGQDIADQDETQDMPASK